MFLSEKKTMNRNTYLSFMEKQKLLYFPSFSRPGLFGTNQVGEMLRLRQREMTIWPNFKRVPKKLEGENYICVMKGREKFRLVSPIFRKNIYVNTLENINLPPWQSPVDFFNPDKVKYPWVS